MNDEYIKSLSREELEKAYIGALRFIARQGNYVEFILWAGENELKHCPNCNQMTNHDSLKCLKCKKLSIPKYAPVA